MEDNSNQKKNLKSKEFTIGRSRSMWNFILYLAISNIYLHIIQKRKLKEEKIRASNDQLKSYVLENNHSNAKLFYQELRAAGNFDLQAGASNNLYY
jgi:hypothetical protein